MPGDTNRSSSRILAVLAACLIGVVCDTASEITMPCPRPAFELTPRLDTIAVGATLQYETAFPNGQLVPESGLHWSSSDVQKAFVNQEGLATAHASGAVEIHAIDPSSPPTCPDQWYGTLVIR
jgi:hypothetical protein